ncbi:MAG: hypothetical protein VSS75_003260 [Candidatus Parabeggiatoa sp.]|nr:hypothetical protein [Candidatus Parabeggiatoa sp.]
MIKSHGKTRKNTEIFRAFCVIPWPNLRLTKLVAIMFLMTRLKPTQKQYLFRTTTLEIIGLNNECGYATNQQMKHDF